jgi:hypothetical protein
MEIPLVPQILCPQESFHPQLNSVWDHELESLLLACVLGLENLLLACVLGF